MAQSNERVILKRGKSATLPTEKESGAILIETDTGVTYVDNSSTDRVQLKDPTKLPLSGGTMTGDIDMGDNNITTSHVPENDEDVVNKAFLEDSIIDYKGIDPIIVDGDEIRHQTYGEESGGPSASIKLDFGDSFKVPNVTSNEYGHTVNILDRTITIPEFPDTITHADEADHAEEADHAKEADNALDSEHSDVADEAKRLSEEQTIDGVSFDGLEPVVHYGVCSTAAGTATKVVSCDNFVLDTGANVEVRFNNTNTASAPSLNVNGTGAKSIHYNGSALSSSTANYILADHVYRFVYDGSYYNVVGDIDIVYSVKSPIGLDSSHVIYHESYGSQQGGPNRGGKLDYNDTFDVPAVTSDDYGHVTKISTQSFTMPDPYTAKEPIEMSDSNEISHKNYDAVSVGPTADTKVDGGGSFNVPQIVSDEFGHITSGTNRKITIPEENAYTGIDPIEVANYQISHAKASSVKIGPTEGYNLGYGDSFNVPYLESDGYGHVTSGSTMKFTLPDAPSSGGGSGGEACYYAVCSTASGTAAKTVDCGDEFTLEAGVVIIVKFENTNSANNPTLNVSGTGAHTIKFQDENVSKTGLVKGTLYTFVYGDGAYNLVSGSFNRTDIVEDDDATFRNIIIVDKDDDPNELDVPIGSVILQKSDKSGSFAYYGVCSTSSSTKAKSVTCDNFTLLDGTIIYVKFENTNTADNPTLNISNTGAYNIVFQDEKVASAGLVEGTVYTFIYSNESYNLVSGSFNRTDIVEDDNASFRNIVIVNKNDDPNQADVPVGSIILQKTNEITAEEPIQFSEDNVISHDKGTSIDVGPSGNSTLDYGDSFIVPSVQSDEYGHISGGGNRTITLPELPEESNSNYYGVCSTASGTKAKVVSCDGFVLEEGAMISVYFENTHTGSSGMTLNVNSTGAIDVTYQNDDIIKNGIQADKIYTFVYTADKYQARYELISTALFRSDIVEDSQNEFRNVTILESTQNEADIDVPVGSVILKKQPLSVTREYYGTSSTAAGTATKVVICSGFELENGATIKVTFSHTNTNSSPKLNINSTGAKSIYYKGEQVGSNTLVEDATYEFVYRDDIYDMVCEDVSDVSEEVAQLQSDLKTTQSDLKTTQSDVDDLKSDVSNIESDVKNLEDSTDDYALRKYYSDDSVNVGRKSNTTTGTNSFAFGSDCEASANYSHSEGHGTVASGSCTHAEGEYSEASGSMSHAEGRSTKATMDSCHAEGSSTSATGLNAHSECCATTASGNYSHSEGLSTNATGQASHAEGNGTTASGNQSHAEGYNSKATGASSHAEGQGTEANGNYAHTEGNATIADGGFSHAEGNTTTASGAYSHSEGSHTQATNSYTHAEGYRTTASGQYAHAEGISSNAGGTSDESSNASGDASHVEGCNTKSSGNYSHAEGQLSEASGAYSHAEGYSTSAKSNGAHAEGYNTSAELNSAHAEGNLTTASGQYSHAEGYQSTASASTTHSEGYRTTASTNYAHAEGNNSVASGNTSHAEGYYTEASGSYSHSEGSNTIASAQHAHAEGGSSVASASNTHAEGESTTASDVCSHAEGYLTTASGKYAHAEGWSSKYGDSDGYTDANGDGSHAEGRDTRALGNYSHSEGWSSRASGDGSHAEGYMSRATGLYSHAEGQQGHSDGDYSHAEGWNTYAEGSYSHAEGYSTEADGNYGAHTEGYYTAASANYSHAEGYNTKASNTACHSEGYYSNAATYYSHAGGYYTQTGGAYCQTVIGHRNTVSTTSGTNSNTSGDAFIIGNGTSSSNTGNAMRVTFGGSTYSLSAFNSSGADYAEFIKEWADGNPDEEDRVGYFVTIKDGLLYKADEDDYIVGITSGNPSVIGNADETYFWKYERDEFGRFLKEDVDEEIIEPLEPETREEEVDSEEEEVDSEEESDDNKEESFDNKEDEKEVNTLDNKEETQEDDDSEIIEDENGNKYKVTKTGNIIKDGIMVLSSDYDSSKEYVERKDRPEWDYVGMLGVIPVRDDGTCKVDAYCKCGGEGIATFAEERGFDTYRVIERVTENVVLVIMR